MGTRLLTIDSSTFEYIVHDALRVKGDIVSRDEKEKGERRKLNFGHTLGHAIEKVYGLRHGEAVSIGMVIAARLSVESGLLSESDLKRIQGVLEVFGLPTAMSIDSNSIVDALRKDKKREESFIHFVLLNGIGSATLVPLEIHEIGKVIDDLCKPR
jgi:3-dehydroquinate synthase